MRSAALLGFAADKCDLADHYLPRSARWYGADPDRVYMGNPHKDDGSPETGYYCFAGPVVAAANAYLAAHGGGYTAHDLTGAGEDGLLRQLERGRPVIFWATLRFNDVQFDACGGYALPGGGYHRVFHTLHCMALCGAGRHALHSGRPAGAEPPRAARPALWKSTASWAAAPWCWRPRANKCPDRRHPVYTQFTPQAAKLQACFVSRTEKKRPAGRLRCGSNPAGRNFVAKRISSSGCAAQSMPADARRPGT